MAATVVRRTGIAALIASAAVLGGWARPYVAAVKSAWTAPPGPPQPLSAPLWTAKTDQFRVLPRSAPAGVRLVVYVGDSITDWVNLDEFVEAPGLRVLNRGISGDTVSGIAARLVESVPAGTTVCFLMAGYNDIALGESIEDTAGRLIDAAGRLRGRARHVVIESVPPPGNEHDAAIASLNRALASRAGQRDDMITFLDLTPAFVRDGRRDPSLFAAGAHLSAAGALRRLRAEMAHLAAIDAEVGRMVRVVVDE